MEPAPPEKRGRRGEETLMTVVVFRAVCLLTLHSQTKEWFHVADWGYISVACCLVLQLLAIYNFPVTKIDGQTEMIVFRPGVISGVYCGLLVPLAVLTQVLQSPGGSFEELSEVAFLLATTGGLLLLAPSQLKLKYSVLYTTLLVSGLLLTLSHIHFGGNSLPWLSGGVVVMCCGYYLPILCPWSFTFGELCVVCQILGAIVFRMAGWMDRLAFEEKWPTITHEVYVYVFISVLVVFVALASTLVLYWDWCDTLLPFLLVYFACGLMAIGVLMFLTGHHPVVWILVYIFGENRRVSLLVWWSAVAVMTLISFVLYTQHVTSQSGAASSGGGGGQAGSKGGRASTRARKAFHCVVVAVYVPGLVVDPLFMLLASAVAMAALCVLEVSRLINVQWLGSVVENSFRVFVDDRDQGPVLLTHIYLLVGLSLPLWLTHDITDGDIRNYCGVISLGIGDTVACVVGMQYGNTKWPGTKKSLEGTSASILAQLIFIIFAFYTGWLVNLAWLNMVFAVLISSVFEAVVSQIDNLVLPVFMMAALPPLPL